MTLDEIKEEIKSGLGDPIICVELQPNHYDLAVERAERWFIADIGVIKLLDLTVAATENEYTLDDDVMDVIDVFREGHHIFSDDVFGFDAAAPYLFSGANAPFFGRDPLGYSDLTQRLQYLDTIKKTLGVDKSFEYDKQTRILRLYPQPSSSSGTAAIVQYMSRRVDVEKLFAWELDIFIRWAEAEAKEILGRIRSRFDTIPTPGGDRALDGPILLEEDRQQKEALREEARERQGPASFIVH